MTDRAAACADFLRAAGIDPGSARSLAGDASNRRYLRAGGHVVMDAPPEAGEDVRPFIAMTDWLCGHGFSAPAILAADAEQGFLLLEDLGDGLYTPLLADGRAGEAELYGAAVDLTADLAAIPAPAEIGPPECRLTLSPYDGAVLSRESRLLTEWWVPAATENPPPETMSADLDGIVAAATAAVAEARGTVVLRDYHADNLVWLPGRQGAARVGLLDYQDALAGHPAYDLVSLLEDARRDTSDALQQAMVARYLARRPAADPEADPEAFRAAYAALGAQRNMKIVGIFARLALRDGKPRYLTMIPRVWGHLMRDVSHPALDALRSWLARHVPAPEPALLDRIARRIGP